MVSEIIVKVPEGVLCNNCNSLGAMDKWCSIFHKELSSVNNFYIYKCKQCLKNSERAKDLMSCAVSGGYWSENFKEEEWSNKVKEASND